MASRDKVDVDMFHKSIQYALEKLGKSKSGFERTVVSKFKRKRRVGSGNELVDYSRAPCLGADQKTRGLWDRDCGCHYLGDMAVRMPDNGLVFECVTCLYCSKRVTFVVGCVKCVSIPIKKKDDQPLRVAKNCMTRPLPRVRKLMTHPLSAPGQPPPPYTF